VVVAVVAVVAAVIVLPSNLPLRAYCQYYLHILHLVEVSPNRQVVHLEYDLLVVQLLLTAVLVQMLVYPP
jgi:hypothetical protein